MGLTLEDIKDDEIIVLELENAEDLYIYKEELEYVLTDYDGVKAIYSTSVQDFDFGIDNIEQMLENIGDNMYEGWVENMLIDLENDPIVLKFIDKMFEAYNRNVCYIKEELLQSFE